MAIRDYYLGGRAAGKTARAKELIKDIPNVTTPKPRPVGSPRLLGATVTPTGMGNIRPAETKKQPYRNQPLRHNVLLADLKTALLKEGENRAQ